MTGKRNLESLRRNKEWTAWDINCKSVVSSTPRFRKRMRRAAKRAWRSLWKREVLTAVVEEPPTYAD